ncbi:centriolin [Chaetodon trifascialis]|uniref:centriolin n=1 Tax=Chaetodon trifascialis TaxID=109706 RepID=UPI0039951334
MEVQREAGGGADSRGNRGGIRYMTEELLLKLTGCPSLALIRSLNLSSSPGDKRFKFIENLHSCQHLEILRLNHNWIQKMERLKSLTELRELQLAHNSIQRIEGLELMSRLQHLNLSYNRIDHVPVWLGKKLQSLHTLHLQHNLITSLYEVSRLRSLSSLSELSVSGNPVCSLQHSRLFLLYHLRTLDRLDDLPVTQEERGHAQQRFSDEELERLQREADSSQSELSRLQRAQQVAVTRLLQQEETNRTLTAQTETQRHTHTLLEQELHTKSQLLEKTTAELTGAFQRLYELEQEWTFCKIDARFSPLPSCSVQEVNTVDFVAESPYIGKARHIRSTITSTPRTSSPSSSSLQTQETADIHTDRELSHPLLEDCGTEQSKAEADLQFSHQSACPPVADQPMPEETKRHRQEALCWLLRKLSTLEHLRDEAAETLRQMDRRTEESRKTERETEKLESQLLTPNPTDPQPAEENHVTARLSSCRRPLDKMSGKKDELEDRLNDMLSRIAMETQEIKELEQQLTDGQILANEALQRDLEGIICGLQEYLRGLREQARCAQQQVHSLQAENQSLQLHLEDSQRHCRQLEDSARTQRQDMSVQQEELSVLRIEAQAHRDRQVESSRQQMELEAELQRLREELTRQITLGQLEREALQAAVAKEKHIRESQLQSTIDILQDEKSSLGEAVQRLQAQLDQTKAQFHQTRAHYEVTRTHLDQTRIQMDQITAALLDSEVVQRTPEELDQDQCSPVSPEDMLSRSLEQLYRAIQQTRTSRDHLQQDYNRSQEQMARLQSQLDQNQDHITHLEAQLVQDQDQKAQLESQVICDEEQDQDSDRRLKEELERLRGRLQRTQCRNRQTQHKLEAELEQSRLQLQDVQQQRDTLLQQLRLQSDSHQRSLGRLNRKLRQLSRSMCDSDQLTVEQLKSTSEQLRALNHTVELLHTHTPQAPTLDSQGTRDSGLGLQYLSSPERGRQQDRPPTGGGRWVCFPPTKADSDTAAEWRDSGGGSGRSSRGPTPPPVPAAAVPAGLSRRHTPLDGPAWLLCASPAAVSSPPAGGAALHCNIPEHGDTQVDRCVCMHKDAERLEEERKKLRLETKQLRHTLRRHRSVMQVCDEVECVEKTLLKRRAELRQADRLLLEAQSCIHTTTDKATVVQCEADVLRRTARDSAACLLEATQHIRELQEEVEELRRRRQVEEQTLREVDEALRSRDHESQQLSTKIQSAGDRLAGVLSDCQDSQQRLDSLISQVEQQEQKLLQSRAEHQTAVNRVEEVRQEEQRLQVRVKELLEQQEALWSERRSTESAVRGGQQRVLTVQAELHTHRAELRQVLQELLVEQHALEEVKTKRSQSLQQLHKKQSQLDRIRDEVDGTRDEVDRMRDELDKTREEVEKRNAELEKKQEEVDKRRDKLDKMQEEADRKRKELAELQQEVESHRTEAEVCLKETKEQRTELQQQQEELSRRREERSSIQEQCKHLEARRRHADKCLSAVQVELAKHREEHSHAQLLKQEVVRDTDAAREQLNENSELLSLLSGQVDERKRQLQTLEQELSVSRRLQQQRAEELKQLDTHTQHRQEVCVGLEDVKAAVCQLDDRWRRLAEQEQQLNQLKEELWERETQLLHKEEGLKPQEAGLQLKEEGLQNRCEEDEGRKEEEEEEESFYLSTAGLRSAFSTEEERWKVELQREKLRQREDRLKARLRCSLWNQQETLEVRRQETEESLQGLRHRLDQLDSLLTG